MSHSNEQRARWGHCCWQYKVPGIWYWCSACFFFSFSQGENWTVIRDWVKRPRRMTHFQQSVMMFLTSNKTSEEFFLLPLAIMRHDHSNNLEDSRGDTTTFSPDVVKSIIIHSHPEHSDQKQSSDHTCQDHDRTRTQLWKFSSPSLLVIVLVTYFIVDRTCHKIETFR